MPQRAVGQNRLNKGAADDGLCAGHGPLARRAVASASAAVQIPWEQSDNRAWAWVRTSGRRDLAFLFLKAPQVIDSSRTPSRASALDDRHVGETCGGAHGRFRKREPRGSKARTVRTCGRYDRRSVCGVCACDVGKN